MRHILAAIFILFVILGLCACNASKKAHKYFNTHQDEFAKDCADAFPCIDSSVTKIDTVISTVIVDHTKEIDSLSNSFDSLANSKYEDSVLAAMSHEKCKEVVDARAKEINNLKAQIASLRANYKPAASTIVRINTNHYIRDSARERALAQDRDKWKLKAENYKDKFNWWLIACLITWLAIAVGFVFRFLIIKKPL